MRLKREVDQIERQVSPKTGRKSRLKERRKEAAWSEAPQKTSGRR